MKRKALGLFGPIRYSPATALPEELTFDVLDENDKVTGSIVYAKMGFSWMRTEDSTLDTPWGKGRVGYTRQGFTVFLNERELFTVGGRLFQKGVDLVTPAGTRLPFQSIKGKKDDIEFSDGKGYILVAQEEGSLSEHEAGRRMRKTKEDIMMLPKNERPTTVESQDYVQYRIKVSGVLPIPEKELVAGLAIVASLGSLINEMSSPAV